MAEQRMASRTTLVWEGMATPVALWKTTGSPPKAESWDSLAEPVAEGGNVNPSNVNPGGGETAPLGVSRGEFVDSMRSGMGSGSIAFTAGEPVKRRRGVTREDGTFVDLTEQIAALEERAKLDEMAIVGFVRSSAIPRARIIGSYYLGIDDRGNTKLLKLLREAMTATSRTAVVRWTKSTRQALGLIVPGPGGCLMVVEMAWAEDAREAPARAMSFTAAEVSEDELAAAVDLVGVMSEGAGVSLESLRDDARVWAAELRNAARAGKVEAFRVPVRREPVAEVTAETLRDAARAA